MLPNCAEAGRATTIPPITSKQATMRVIDTAEMDRTEYGRSGFNGVSRFRPVNSSIAAFPGIGPRTAGAIARYPEPTACNRQSPWAGALAPMSTHSDGMRQQYR